jgi:hypothetical protein
MPGRDRLPSSGQANAASEDPMHQSAARMLGRDRPPTSGPVNAARQARPRAYDPREAASQNVPDAHCAAADRDRADREADTDTLARFVSRRLLPGQSAQEAWEQAAAAAGEGTSVRLVSPGPSLRTGIPHRGATRSGG